MKIVLLEGLGISAELLSSYTEQLTKKGHTFTAFEKTADEDKLIAEAKDADAVILANMPITEKTVRGWDNVKYIDIAFTGVDHVPVKTAKEMGMALSNASGYSTEAVAELTVAQMINLNRNVKQTDERARTSGTKEGLVGRELGACTIGLVGYGKIGRRVAEICHVFGCKVLATSKLKTSGSDGIANFVSLDEVLKESDIVSLHCPLNEHTKGLIGADELRRMKKTAYLINTARGNVVDKKALCDALQNREIAGAAVDVFDREPPLDPNDELLACPNLLVTPHIAFASKESMEKRAAIVFDNLNAWLNGEIKNPV